MTKFVEPRELVEESAETGKTGCLWNNGGGDFQF